MSAAEQNKRKLCLPKLRRWRENLQFRFSQCICTLIKVGQRIYTKSHPANPQKPSQKFIPARNIEVVLEEIPEKLEFKQRGGSLPKLVKPNFRWSPVKGAQHYELASKNLQSGKWHYFGHIKCTKFCLPENLDTGKYLWKVRAGGDKYSRWSLPAKFVIDNKGNSRNLDLEFHNNIELKRKEISQDETILRSTPIQLAVRLEGRGCNIDCIFCMQKFQKIKVKFYPELIEDLANYLPSVKTVSFGSGEPMIYPEFKQICDMVENYPETQLSICTNGMLIDEYWADRFCKGNFPWIRISVDAATPDTYAAIRRRGDLERVLHGVDLINRYRQKKEEPRIQWNFVVTTLNLHEIVQTVELASQYNVNVINFQELLDLTLFAGSPLMSVVREEFKKEYLKVTPNEEACHTILNLLAEAEYKAAKYGIRTIDHVRPRIFNLFPHLANSTHSPGLIEPQTHIQSRVDPYICDDNLELTESQTSIQPPKTADFFCHMPFINLAFGNGRAHFCCYTKHEFLFITYNDKCEKIDKIWNSAKFQEARLLMFENSEKARERICKPICPYYNFGFRTPLF